MKRCLLPFAFSISLLLTACAETKSTSGPPSLSSQGENPWTMDLPSKGDNNTHQKRDCGSKELENCDLFGLPPSRLRYHRSYLTMEPTQGTLNERELIIFRVNKLLDSMRENNKFARVELTKENEDDFLAYYNSIKWL